MPTKVAEIAPIYSCPSVPMLNMPPLNAMPDAMPQSRNAVVQRMVEERALTLPSEPRMRYEYTSRTL